MQSLKHAYTILYYWSPRYKHSKDDHDKKDVIKREVSVHARFSISLDTDNIRFIFSSVRDAVIQTNLAMHRLV